MHENGWICTAVFVVGMVLSGIAFVLLAVLIAYLFGRRKGRKRRSVVEIRRI